MATLLDNARFLFPFYEGDFNLDLRTFNAALLGGEYVKIRKMYEKHDYEISDSAGTRYIKQADATSFVRISKNCKVMLPLCLQMLDPNGNHDEILINSVMRDEKGEINEHSKTSFMEHIPLLDSCSIQELSELRKSGKSIKVAGDDVFVDGVREYSFMEITSRNRCGCEQCNIPDGKCNRPNNSYGCVKRRCLDDDDKEDGKTNSAQKYNVKVVCTESVTDGSNQHIPIQSDKQFNSCYMKRDEYKSCSHEAFVYDILFSFVVYCWKKIRNTNDVLNLVIAADETTVDKVKDFVETILHIFKIRRNTVNIIICECSIKKNGSKDAVGKVSWNHVGHLLQIVKSKFEVHTYRYSTGNKSGGSYLRFDRC